VRCWGIGRPGGNANRKTTNRKGKVGRQRKSTDIAILRAQDPGEAGVEERRRNIYTIAWKGEQVHMPRKLISLAYLSFFSNPDPHSRRRVVVGDRHTRIKPHRPRLNGVISRANISEYWSVSTQLGRPSRIRYPYKNFACILAKGSDYRDSIVVSQRCCKWKLKWKCHHLRPLLFLQV
jgi:hypothetical protein